MRLLALKIHNYKSLRHTTFRPKHLSCLVGPNAAGKSNFADAFHFLSEVYIHGLEVAVARKGGYENIAHRKQRRSKAPIRFSLDIQLRGDEVPYLLADHHTGSEAERHEFRFRHSFSIRALGTGIRAAFRVERETFRLSVRMSEHEPLQTLVELRRKTDGSIELKGPVEQPGEGDVPSLQMFERYYNRWLRDLVPTEQELFVTTLPGRHPYFIGFTRAASRFAVFRFTPDRSRSPGVPTPNPELSFAGGNLPALVDWLKQSYGDLWEIVMLGMRDMVPGLEDISVQYLHTKALGLFFHEQGIGRPWIADDVSDGTIQVLAMLVASVDPRTSLLIVEEPENSVHPWIVRNVVRRFRKVSEQKNVIITTHSPILLDQMEPSEVWVVSRPKNETSLTPVTELDAQLEIDWREGRYGLSSLLDSGLVPRAVPGGSE